MSTKVTRKSRLEPEEQPSFQRYGDVLNHLGGSSAGTEPPDTSSTDRSSSNNAV